MTQTKWVAQISQAPPEVSTPSNPPPISSFDMMIMAFLGFVVTWGTALWVVTKPRKNLPKGQSLSRQDNIPCRNCKFFNHNCHLKCAVNPMVVMTESAIDCADYCSYEQPLKKLSQKIFTRRNPP